MSLFDPLEALAAATAVAPISDAVRFVQGLTPSARLAIPFIDQGVRAGLSLRDIYNYVAEGGLNITRDQVLSLGRQGRSARAAAAYQNSLAPDILPDPARFTAAQNLLSRNYVYHVRVDAIFNETGAAGIQYVSISTDTLLTNSDLAEAVDNIIQTSPTDYNMQVTSATVEEVYIDPRALT